MKLLPLEALQKTGPVDHADWNYKPVLGWIQRLRFDLVLRLMKSHHYRRILEIGYGSGVFLPELARHCDQLYGVDVHPRQAEVQATLATLGVKAELHCSGAESLPFDNEFFECVVVVSALEFVSDLERVCQEAERVLAPGGRMIVITPGASPVLDFGLKVLTGKSAEEDFGGRRAAIVPTLERWFTVEKVQTFPPVGHSMICVYRALDCRRRGTSASYSKNEQPKSEQRLVGV